MTYLRTLLACGLALGLGTAAMATEIGVVAATNTKIDGTPPSIPTRTLAVSDRLLLAERVQSSDRGSGQFLFDDQTSLTIAPNTDIVLDTYVFDPDRDAGQIALSFNKGVMRFIGGRISKTSDAVVTTPVATIGIRGGITLFDMQTPDSLRVIHVAGEYSKVSSAGKTLTLTRTNAVATVDANGAITYAGVATAGDVGALYDSLRGDGGGGARERSDIAGANANPNLTDVARNNSAVGQPPVGTDGSAPEDVETLDNNFDVSGIDPAQQSLRFQDEGFIRDVALNIGDVIVDVGGEGLVRGQLVWTNNSDLDLHLVLPGGAGEVFFGDSEIVFNDGGAVAELDADNLGGVINVGPDKRVENITVTGTDIPAGVYTFFIENFNARGNVATDFDLTVTGNGRNFTTTSGTLADNEVSGNIPVQSAGGSFIPTAPGT